MENWKIYGEGIIPKGKYSGNLFYKEGVKPVIELKSWNNGEIMFYVNLIRFILLGYLKRELH